MTSRISEIILTLIIAIFSQEETLVNPSFGNEYIWLVIYNDKKCICKWVSKLCFRKVLFI